MTAPLLRSRDTALWLGIGCWIAGAVLLRDAYERRGRPRPAGFKVMGLFQ